MRCSLHRECQVGETQKQQGMDEFEEQECNDWEQVRDYKVNEDWCNGKAEQAGYGFLDQNGSSVPRSVLQSLVAMTYC